MKIAMPLTGGSLSSHFGHCERFAVIDANPATKSILASEEIVPPPHEPGLFPAWLAERGVTHIIAGGMGQNARNLFAKNRIEVVVGAPSEPSEKIVKLFLEGTLVTGANSCDH
ncbi:MAG: dinitrogenase iron-molybdenum cofactor biosynthesis protein [Spirochaetaceae bacterium]|nr:dinitrogenase iron-molybdenum cofactor biosynthesis protein [Spirochaetaceae bacterium]